MAARPPGTGTWRRCRSPSAASPRRRCSSESCSGLNTGSGLVAAPPSAARALAAAFAVFAGAFVMRPVGGVLFGYIGDKYGRVYSMRLAMSLMALPTCRGWTQTGALGGHNARLVEGRAICVAYSDGNPLLRVVLQPLCISAVG